MANLQNDETEDLDTALKVAKQRQIDNDHQKFLDMAFRRLDALQKELHAIDHQKFLDEAYYRLDALQKELDDMPSTRNMIAPIAYVTNKQDPVRFTPPTTNIPPTEVANASLQHPDSGTSTTKPSDYSLSYGPSQTQNKIDNSENPTKAVKRSARIASVPKQPKQDPGKTETKPKRDPVPELKNNRKDVKLVATARKPSWDFTGSSRTQKRTDNSKNPTKGVKRSDPSASVTKQPKQDPIKTETKPKKPCVTVKVKTDARQDLKVLATARKVSKPKNYEREDVKLLPTARRVIMTLKTETKPKQDCIAKLKTDEKEDIKLLPTARKPSQVVTGSSQTRK